MPKELSSHLRASAHRCLSPVQTCPRFTSPVDFSTRGSQRRLDRMAKLAIPDLAFPLHAAAAKSRHSRGHLTHLPLSPTPLRVYHLNAYLLTINRHLVIISLLDRYNSPLDGLPAPRVPFKFVLLTESPSCS